MLEESDGDLVIFDIVSFDENSKLKHLQVTKKALLAQLNGVNEASQIKNNVKKAVKMLDLEGDQLILPMGTL